MIAIEILAIIFAGVVLLKLAIIIINPKSLLKVSEAMFKTRIVILAVYLALAVIVGHYVFESLDIIEVAAVMLFTSILIGLGIIPYSEGLLKFTREMLVSRQEVLRKIWLAILIWLALAVWVLYAVLC